MLDPKFVESNVNLVKKNCAQRGVNVDIDHFVGLQNLRRVIQESLDLANQSLNRTSKQMATEKDPQVREILIGDGKRFRAAAAVYQSELKEIAEKLNTMIMAIPNLSHPDAPVGADDKANLEIRKGKTPVPTFDFTPKDHVELGEALELLDFEAGGRVAGHGFYYLKNEAVLLELALQQYAMQTLIKEGFTPIITPDLARNEILSGVGFIPRGPETQIYSIENTDLSLIATAEITLGGMLSGETLDADQLPLTYCGISHCYRTEAGAHGKATRGLYRVHQFTKIEMFAFTLPEQSDAMHERLCQLECQIFDGLGLAYRVVDTATGDLGGPAYRKFDLEAWMPGRGDGGEFGEVTSTSNCTDYQARRLNIRYKKKGEKGTHFVHTLNGTAIAVSRALIAILENYQQADGSVVIPKALRSWLPHERIAAKGRRSDMTVAPELST